MPWNHVSSTVTSLLGYDEKLDCVLPCSSGVLMNVEEKFVNTLTDLKILSATQCENKEFLNSDIRKQFSDDQEREFYKGQRVSWWNFFFKNHVCSREIYDKIQKKASEYLIHAKEETRKVVTLSIAHEPGAGATTLGHQLLWDFRKDNRCCVIVKLSKETMRQIVLLFNYNEVISSVLRPNPVVLFLDDISQTELSVSDFTRQLIIEFRKDKLNYVDDMSCLLIICQREEKLRGNEFGRENIFYLKQELSKDEKAWFTDKSIELEKKGDDIEDYQPQHLISFIILRSEFEMGSIQKTLQTIISLIDEKSNEYKLLTYVSFLATYTPCQTRGMKVFVPLECCDNLMEVSPFWERGLSKEMKILLIIEKSDLDGGSKVRIAHPILGEEILREIMSKENAELFHIAKEFLSCSLFDSSSLGYKRLVEFTTDMLIRRKKDEFNTLKSRMFSQLIEEIIGDFKLYGMAAEILKLGFEKFQDPLIAQALARLYSDCQNYAEAIKWAKDAVDFSFQHQSAPFILHTYGLVLRDNFKHLTKNRTFCPQNIHGYLDLILKSLEAFFEAKNEQDDITDTQKLLTLLEVIVNINHITIFLRDNVIYNYTNRDDVIRYLKDPHFFPDEICEIWSRFHEKLKQLGKEAEDAFKILENNVCFYSIFSDEVLQSTSQPKREDIFYRRFHDGYKFIYEKFSRIYGESSLTVNGGDLEENDSFHRGRLWTLKGNSYMNIFNHIKNTNVKATIDVLCEIKRHLDQIKSKSSNDLANEICVNVALGIVGYSKRDSESNILKTCQRIIDLRDENDDLAHFFKSMLLWTDNTMSPQIRHSSLEISLSYLKQKFKKRKYKKNVQKNESKFSQPRTQFFLGKGRGIPSLCHTSQIQMFGKKGANSQFDNSLWEENATKDRLSRLHGTIEISEDGRRTIVYCIWDKADSEFIKISNIRGLTSRFLPRERVSFYLGFSIAGPIAYNTKSAQDKSIHQGMRSHHRLTPRVELYLKETEEELEQHLKNIKKLETKSQHRLKEREKQLLKDKDDIIEALEQLQIKNENADFSDLFE